jgi:protein CpxP
MAIAKNKILLIIVGVLLVVNLGVLLLFLNMKQPGNRSVRDGRGRQGMSEILEKKAGFSKQQLKAYQELREQHWTRIKPLLADLRNAKDTFYRLLYQPEVPDSVLSRAADVIGNRQKAIDLQTFRHFQQVRGLCDPSQRPKLDSLIQQVVTKMGGPFRRENIRLRKAKPDQ